MSEILNRSLYKKILISFIVIFPNTTIMTSKTSKPIKSTRDNKKSSKNGKKLSKNVKHTKKQSIQKKNIRSGSKTSKPNQTTKKSSVSHVGQYSFKVLKDDKFRLQAQKVFFTYKHHIPFDTLVNFIDKLFPISQYIVCHEDGDEQHNYLHTHISIEFKKKIDVCNCRRFDITFNNEVIHPNIGVTRNWPASCIYCLKIWKKDPSEKNKNWFANFDVLEFLKKNKRNKCVQDLNIKELCKRIESYKSVSEVIENEAQDLRDVIALKTIFENKRREIDPNLVNYFKKWEKQMRKWQIDLYNVIDKKPNRRTVYWVVDSVGGQGKTDFCTYVDTFKKKDECLTIASTGSLRDIADVIRNWMDRGAYPKIILIDLPRTFKDRDSIFTTIESVKNGRLTCTKYKGDTIQFNPPHVMIFSNWMPDISLLSKDRWVILNLKAKHANDKNATLKKLNIDDLETDTLPDDVEEISFDPEFRDSEDDSLDDSNEDMSFDGSIYDSVDINDNDIDDDVMSFHGDLDVSIEELPKVTKNKVTKNLLDCFVCEKSFDKKLAKDTIKNGKGDVIKGLCSDKCVKRYDDMMW